MLILFDYGHGGKDPGATYKGRKEADDVLKVGQTIAKHLRAAGITVDETRTANTTLTLEQRVTMELKKTYDFFISFHRNAFKPEQATGAEVFVYSSSNAKSTQLGKKIQQALVKVGFKDRGVKQADFYVLKYTRAPALLLEIGFIDNSKDNVLFDSRFKEIAEGVAAAIIDGVGLKKARKCEACGQGIV